MSNGCINKLPAAFLLILFATFHAIYVYNFCWQAVQPPGNRIGFLVGINLLALMFLWSFFATMWSSVGAVPAEYKFSRNEHQSVMKARTDDEKDHILETLCEKKSLLLQTCTPTGSIRCETRLPRIRSNGCFLLQVLHELHAHKTRPDSSLQQLRTVFPENGPSLSLGEQLHRLSQPQELHFAAFLHICILRFLRRYHHPTRAFPVGPFQVCRRYSHKHRVLKSNREFWKS